MDEPHSNGRKTAMGSIKSARAAIHGKKMLFAFAMRQPLLFYIAVFRIRVRMNFWGLYNIQNCVMILYGTNNYKKI